MTDDLIRITDAPVSAARLRDRVARPGCGAIVAFEGTVRDHTGDFDTDHLVYEAYAEMAEKVLRELAAEAADRWPLGAVAVHHRTGRLEVGEVSVAIAVSAPHRDPAFAACRHVIDELKTRAPIWKKEVGPDGEAWIEGPRRETVEADATPPDVAVEHPGTAPENDS